MAVQKSGQLLSTGQSTLGEDKHKFKFIGIAFVVILILAIFLLLTRGCVPTQTQTTSIIEENATDQLCMNIRHIILADPTGFEAYEFSDLERIMVETTTDIRETICTQAGCTFSGGDTRGGKRLTSDLNDDFCTGRLRECPRIDEYNYSGYRSNLIRKDLCTSAGCTFTDGGDDSVTDDRCV